MIKIAFFDVDGTLLKMGHKELSERTLHALISLRRNGVKLCMATGRGYLSAPRFPGIDFDALLTFNGSYVTVGDEIKREPAEIRYGQRAPGQLRDLPAESERHA